MPQYRTRKNLFEQLVDPQLETGTPPADRLECPICLEAWQQMGVSLQAVVRTRGCKHFFHRGCLMNWICSDDQQRAIKINTTCPYCRTDIFEYIEPTLVDSTIALNELEQIQDAYEHRYERHTRIIGFFVIRAMFESGNENNYMGTPEGIDAMIDYVLAKWRFRDRAWHVWQSIPLVDIDMSEDAVRFMLLLHLGWSMPNWRQVDPRVGQEYFEIARHRHVSTFNQESREYALSLLIDFHTSNSRSWTFDELAMFEEATRYLNSPSV